MSNSKVRVHDLKVMKPGEVIYPEIPFADSGPTELRLPEELTLEQWSEIGHRLCRIEKTAQWWIGDWAAFGAGDKERKQKDWRKYGKLKEFADANGLDYQTLRNLAWVSRSVPLSRRRDNLHWRKHAEVAALPAAQQEKWLAKVEKEELSCAELRRQIRQSSGENNALESDGPVIKFGSKSCDELIGWLRSRPDGFWTEDRRHAWRERLIPIVKFFEQL